MYCEKCGAKIEENAKFCVNCGNAVQQKKYESANAINEDGKTETEHIAYERVERRKQMGGLNANKRLLKTKKIVGILEIIFGALLLILGMGEAEYDWGMISLIAGIGIMVTGILRVRRMKEKVCNIIYIVFGAVTALSGFGCDLEYDWGYFGIVIGIVMLVSGILGLLHKSIKIIGIVEIVFAGILIILGGMCIDFTWGITGFFAGTMFLVVGILWVVNSKYEIKTGNRERKNVL